MFIDKEDFDKVDDKFENTFSKMVPRFGDKQYLGILYDINRVRKEERLLLDRKSEKKQNEIKSNIYFLKKKLITQMKKYDI